ncbi:MAG: glycosyltransferase family 4 protein [Halanaerobiales bacterium]
MKILMFSWEYAPLNQGGLARHVQDLSEALSRQNHQLYIITQGADNIPEVEVKNGVNIFRSTPVNIGANNFIDGILHLNFQLLETAINAVSKISDIDLIHGHDWLVFWACKVLKHALKKPLIFTIHATEYGRNQGIYNDMQRYINDLEWYANFEAWRVIVCSRYMKNEVRNLFQVPEDKIKVIKNGVNPSYYQARADSDFRSRFAAPEEKIVYYVGRLVREKGVQILIRGIPLILAQQPSTKFVIAGKGPHLENLRREAAYLGVEDRIFFTGFISDDVRNKLYQTADVAVFPSLYEPFGIVALEAMATATPVIVSDVGGLAEFVSNNKTGLKVEPGNVHHLAKAVLDLLTDKEKASRLVRQAIKMVQRDYNWEKIAASTMTVYRQVLEEYKSTDWPEDECSGYIITEEKKEYKYIK